MEYTEEDQKEIQTLLLGHRITKVSENILELDDGTQIQFVGNSGCCVCESGHYYLMELNGVDNIITKVEFDYSPASYYDYPEEDGHYRIFVVAEDKRITLAEFEGTDGNEYYGTGYSIIVKAPPPKD